MANDFNGFNPLCFLVLFVFFLYVCMFSYFAVSPVLWLSLTNDSAHWFLEDLEAI